MLQAPQAGGWGWRSWGAAALAAVVLAVAPAALARAPDTPLALPPVALASLPPEAQATHRLIHQGGPFRYDKDGTVFFNRERLLPARPRGHYREYTVRTPGVRNRGARRIVCGGREPTRPEVCYYTEDHYASFSRIVP
jgi:ribonuclease T1